MFYFIVKEYCFLLYKLCSLHFVTLLYVGQGLDGYLIALLLLNLIGYCVALGVVLVGA